MLLCDHALLMAADAQEPGRDIGCGSYAIARVQKRFAAAAATLRAKLARVDSARRSAAEAAAWRAVQADGASRSEGDLVRTAPQPLLGSVLHVDRALGLEAGPGEGLRRGYRGGGAPQQASGPCGGGAAPKKSRQQKSHPDAMQRANPKKRRPAPGPDADEGRANARADGWAKRPCQGKRKKVGLARLASGDHGRK